MNRLLQDVQYKDRNAQEKVTNSLLDQINQVVQENLQHGLDDVRELLLDENINHGFGQ
ncbi:hypothetical protein LC612_13975 [Nostoc sp. CHAB 5834]|nr:hypothetical protein [Nostoc sp. CHAB 5834]